MALVNRVLQRIPESSADLLGDMVIWPDNMNSSEWYYLTIQEVTNSHTYERKANGYETWLEHIANRDWTELEK
ncbi:MAG: hypothetical protein E7228_00875 [Clostridiales bacterium]|nr:hypothetical protein [Clostridiales bacterium]